MQKKPFKNSSRYMTGGNFKNSMTNMFSIIDTKENEKEEEKKEAVERKEKGDILKELEESYRRILGKKKLKQGSARKIIFLNHPDLFFISFKATGSQACWEAAKYFKESFHPYFLGMKTEEIVRTCRAYRIPELDEYAIAKKVPIPILMKKVGIAFTCSLCGKHHFTYEDYCKNLCFIVEGEWTSLPYTTGYILCYKCHEKLM